MLQLPGPRRGRRSGETVEVQIEKAEMEEPDAESSAPLGTHPLALLVRITSHKKGRHPRVEPRRFSLRRPLGRSLRPRMSTRREPLLESVYLQTGPIP